MAPCKLCGEPTRWDDALCTKCGVAQDRMLAGRLGRETNARASFVLGWLAGFLVGLGGALFFLPSLGWL